MIHIKGTVPDGIMSHIKYICTRTRLNQNAVIVVLLRMAIALGPLETLCNDVQEVYKQIQDEVAKEEPPNKPKGV